MITFGDYLLPKSIDEAYEALISKKTARLIGGGCFLRMGKKRLGLAIDLSGAGLDYIVDSGNEIEIGGMTSLRTYETSEVLKDNFGDMIGDSVKHIIGVQLRSIATIGATVYSRYGFSDPITALLALDADIHLHQGGRMSLEDYLKEEGHRRDILEKIIIKKSNKKGAFQTFRNSQVDYAILSVGVADGEKGIRISIGARPQRATLAIKAMDYINENGINEESATKAGQIASEELHYGSNNRGSADYRKELAKILVKRALLEVSK